MKTERITVLASPDFRAFLAAEAQAEGLSISALVRQRCGRELGKDGVLLATLTQQLRLSNAAANAALDQALAALEKAQADIKQMRDQPRTKQVAVL